MDEIYFAAIALAALVGYALENRRDERLHEQIRDLVAEQMLMRERVATVETKLAAYE